MFLEDIYKEAIIRNPEKVRYFGGPGRVWGPPKTVLGKFRV